MRYENSDMRSPCQVWGREGLGKRQRFQGSAVYQVLEMAHHFDIAEHWYPQMCQ